MTPPSLRGAKRRSNPRVRSELRGLDCFASLAAADDTIFLSRSVFAALGEGTLSEAAFASGTAAQDADDRIVYDSETGRIWYDADGNGAGAAVLFATVTAGTALTSADFYAFTPG